jgi:ATP-dependent helicase HrpB
MDLPVDAVLGDLRAALSRHGRAVLQAPPGAGKTTRVPLDLLEHGLEGRLLLLEPRRVAARAAALRLAAGLGESLGGRVGLTTRDERRVSGATRIEVVTEGVVLRRLQRDPALHGVGLVFFDEFHERSLEADLSLAFVEEARAALRDDLHVLVASATLDGPRVAALLDDAPLVEARGREHPVEIEHRPRPGHRQLTAAVADVVEELLDDHAGDVLVFLPGVAEIRRTARELDERGAATRAAVLQLHGGLPPEEQDRALAPVPDGRPKVVLATDLAESSLTIEGVTAVVDAGLAREPRFDPATGMSGLVTLPAPRASATQRAGRAGRTAPGRCVRLWPEREHAARDAHPRPAIATDDLTGAALEVSAWGAEVGDLALLDQPPAATWSRARATLRDLGALDAHGRVTRHGRRLVGLPLHPRLGHLLLTGAALGHPRLAAEVAAVLADRDPVIHHPDHPHADLTTRVRLLRGEPSPPGVRVRRAALRRARREADRLERLARDATADDAAARLSTPDDELALVGALVALGWPDRVAAARPHRRGAYLLAAGRGATVREHDLLTGEPWLAVAHLDRGEREARIHLAAPVSEPLLRDALADRLEDEEEVAWRDGDVVAERRRRLRALVLERAPLARPDADSLHAALLEGIAEEGLELLTWTESARQLQGRLMLLRRELGAAWPDVADETLLANAAEILGPFLLSARRRADLARVDLEAVLTSRCAPDQLAALDRLVPPHLQVPSGSWIRLDYTAGERPVLAVRLQEMLGETRTPTVLEGRVPVLLHLLSPARRPVQVTDDLGGFWDRAYPEVRAELRGRYPKHAWPEDPRRAAPLRGTPRRS